MPSITDHPSARRAIPAVPVLSLATFRPAGKAPPSLLDAPALRHVTSGRIAIGMALRALGVGPGDTVLVPAYHSPSMVPPVHWRGARAVFYRVHPDTTADLDDIAAKLDPTVKAVMATHFFGIPQDLAPLRALCDRHGIGLVEDCAHCLFGTRGPVAVGSSGDYAIGSSMKFFPVYDGGCLVSHRHPLDVRLQGGGAGFEAKAALNTLEAAFAHGRLPVLRAALALPLRLKEALWNRVKARRGARADGTPADGAPAPSTLAPASSDSGFDFDPRWMDRRASLFARLVLRFAARARIVALRRRHYLQLEQALAGLPGCRPLFPALPDGACPWVFPVLFDDPEPVFAALQRARVPVVRFGAVLWPGVDASVCPNSANLGRRLIAFPCHQELSAAERTWLCAAIGDAARAGAAVAA